MAATRPPQALHEVLTTADDLLALEPEELGAIVLQLFETHHQNEKVLVGNYLSRLYPLGGSPLRLPGYPEGKKSEIEIALAEAFSWLEAQTLFIHSPGQPAEWRRLSRRALRALERDRDLTAFKRAQLLPRDLLPHSLIESVHPPFLRGAYDTAVFEAFKAVEVAVREASNEHGANFGNDLVGTRLMSSAFHTKTGPLRDASAATTAQEREAELSLFLGAVGHARNPVSHRVVGMTADEAARLIVFASHLLAIVDERAAP